MWITWLQQYFFYWRSERSLPFFLNRLFFLSKKSHFNLAEQREFRSLIHLEKLPSESHSVSQRVTGPISILQGQRGGSYSQGLVVTKTGSYCLAFEQIFGLLKPELLENSFQGGDFISPPLLFVCVQEFSFFFFCLLLLFDDIFIV